MKSFGKFLEEVNFSCVFVSHGQPSLIAILQEEARRRVHPAFLFVQLGKNV